MKKNSIIFIFLTFGLYTYSQSVCDTISKSGYFLYELSNNSIVIDDMIYRKRVIIPYKKEMSDYSDVYIFDYDPVGKISKSCLNKYIPENAISYRFNFLNDTISKEINLISADTLILNNNSYKLLNLRINSMFIGVYKFPVIQNNVLTYVQPRIHIVLSINNLTEIEK